ncbi:MAG: hypothetical protein J0M08_10795 [Bacteroidetes bacterium]|nr:hypothetical protein [Bacteroidota bacterium]
MLAKLPEKRIEEVANYIDFILKKYEEELLQKGIEKMTNSSKSYEFLASDPDIYTVNDIIEKYSAKG